LTRHVTFVFVLCQFKSSNVVNKNQQSLRRLSPQLRQDAYLQLAERAVQVVGDTPRGRSRAESHPQMAPSAGFSHIFTVFQSFIILLSSSVKIHQDSKLVRHVSLILCFHCLDYVQVVCHRTGTVLRARLKSWLGLMRIALRRRGWPLTICHWNFLQSML